LAAILLALSLAPGTFVRDGKVHVDETVRYVPINAERPADWPQELSLEGAWELSSENPAFGGFSAVLADPADKGFRVFSDRGQTALVPRPGTVETAKIPVTLFAADPAITHTPDIEAAVRDTESGAMWISYEYHNAIRRVDADGTSQTSRPALMQRWSDNGGGEAMARLPDGKFIILAERSHQALLFYGDPTDKVRMLQFRFDPPDNFRPTDMALLPDGRVLILLRAIRPQIPPLASMLVIADPAQIRGRESWPFETLAAIENRDIRDNYEAMLVEADGDKAVTIWLISDDNQSLLQRTLLLRLRWEYSLQTQTAREGETSGPLSQN